MSTHYIEPRLSPDTAVKTLVPADHDGQLLTPDTLVVVINRGRRPLVEKHDAVDYVIPPHTESLVRMKLSAARHFQNRAVVPGTRNVETADYQSFLGILGIDPPEMCEPFTDEECAAFGQAVEAFERAPGEVKVVKTQQARSRIAGQGAGRGKRGLDTAAQATPEAEAALASALTPPEAPIYVTEPQE